MHGIFFDSFVNYFDPWKDVNARLNHTNKRKSFENTFSNNDIFAVENQNRKRKTETQIEFIHLFHSCHRNCMIFFEFGTLFDWDLRVHFLFSLSLSSKTASIYAIIKQINLISKCIDRIETSLKWVKTSLCKCFHVCFFVSFYSISPFFVALLYTLWHWKEADSPAILSMHGW